MGSSGVNRGWIDVDVQCVSGRCLWGVWGGRSLGVPEGCLEGV